MTEQEKVTLIETEQRSKSNQYRIDALEEDLKDIKNDQKAIYKIATSVEVIAQRVSNIEEKVDDTNQEVKMQAKTLQDTEKRLTDRINETESKPLKRMDDNYNKVKVAVLSALATALASGLLAAIISFMK